MELRVHEYGHLQDAYNNISSNDIVTLFILPSTGCRSEFRIQWPMFSPIEILTYLSCEHVIKTELYSGQNHKNRQPLLVRICSLKQKKKIHWTPLWKFYLWPQDLRLSLSGKNRDFYVPTTDEGKTQPSQIDFFTSENFPDPVTASQPHELVKFRIIIVLCVRRNLSKHPREFAQKYPHGLLMGNWNWMRRQEDGAQTAEIKQTRNDMFSGNHYNQ